ncbi:hypothetical protein [Clostridium felsineum]|uniref:Uncharacterized protein n=1 Tax=Clostridium felsineum TaxID=36839 RepID=A0A1S8L8I4_9CLOT|nr:hypothetical protein [Clostridium felsineum]URZ05083.1 hypothetical protein CLROS_004070 [Clostridium felsineum]URZ10124.1 hypothetical protein CROST_008320 [Clostridium felsineum]
MNEISVRYGQLKGISNAEYYEGGQISECKLTEYCEFKTDLGILIPRFQEDGVRTKNTRSVAFYKNGKLKSIALNKRSVIKTSVGNIKAELLTFYESGNVKKVFPVDGKITAFWTEQNEYDLAEELDLTLKIGHIISKFVAISFYDSNKLKSLTLWTRDEISVNSPIGKVKVRMGIAFYENGEIKSLEPINKISVNTPIGIIKAYDITAIGLSGDVNSLCFYENGEIKSLVSSTDKIEIYNKEGSYIKALEPSLKPSLFIQDKMDIIPYNIEFIGDKVKFNNTDGVFSIKENKFKIINDFYKLNKDINSCKACG